MTAGGREFQDAGAAQLKDRLQISVQLIIKVGVEVVMQLINSKCISCLLAGIDACTLTKSELSSLDFTVNRFFSETLQNGQH